MQTVQQLEEFMTKPSAALVEDIKKIDGDILILGIAGKMGPTLAKMAKRAAEEAGIEKRIIGVARFSNKEMKEELEAAGIETITCDLMDEEQLAQLPDIPNIIFMAGNKFGTVNNEHFTWAMNTYVPGRVADKFKNSNIVVFSSGNIYPFTPVTAGNCGEDVTPVPVGEYAMSTLGRERIFTNFSNRFQTKMLMFRLNYAIDLRYGVLLEVAKSVYNNEPVDVTMGSVNVIWQGDANEYAIRSLLHCDSPVKILNVTGPETLSVRWLAKEFARRFNKEAIIIGVEQETALLNTAAHAHKLFGYPRVSIEQMLDMVANWVELDGATLNKPTHFQERKGAF